MIIRALSIRWLFHSVRCLHSSSAHGIEVLSWRQFHSALLNLNAFTLICSANNFILLWRSHRHFSMRQHIAPKWNEKSPAIFDERKVWKWKPPFHKNELFLFLLALLHSMQIDVCRILKGHQITMNISIENNSICYVQCAQCAQALFVSVVAIDAVCIYNMCFYFYSKTIPNCHHSRYTYSMRIQFHSMNLRHIFDLQFSLSFDNFSRCYRSALDRVHVQCNQCHMSSD